MIELHEMDWKLLTLIFFIGASLLLYVVFGGADYGAGVIEALPLNKYREQQTELINKAMGPVWEANHMWLILLIVILFMGFPKAYLLVTTSLHIPVVAILIGILIRGAVFVFRHYDPQPNDESQKVFTRLFAGSSVWTSFWLGVTAASLFRGSVVDLDGAKQVDFYRDFIASWLGMFPVAMGFFVIAIFTFMASILLIEEVSSQISEPRQQDLQEFFNKRLRKIALASNVLVVLLGAAVFVSAHAEGLDLARDFFTHPLSLGCFVLASLLFAMLWFPGRRRHSLSARGVAAGQTILILLGWYSLEWPNVLITRSGPLSFAQAAAPDATLNQLILALIVGSLLIFPSLLFLFRVFKTEPRSTKSI